MHDGRCSATGHTNPAARLHRLATIQSVKLTGDRISVEAVSRDHFQGTAAFLEQAAGEIAQVTHFSIDVTLLALWPKR